MYGDRGNEEGFGGIGDDVDSKGKGYEREEGIEIGGFEMNFLKRVHGGEWYGMRIEGKDGVVVYRGE